MKNSKQHHYTITGPGVDKTVESGPLGISGAINLAKDIPVGDTVYVRDRTGEIYGRVEHVTPKGTFNIWRAP